MVPIIETTGPEYSGLYSSLKSKYQKTSEEAKDAYTTIVGAKSYHKLGYLRKVFYYQHIARVWFEYGIVEYNVRYNGLHKLQGPSVWKDTFPLNITSLDHFKWWRTELNNQFYYVDNKYLTLVEFYKQVRIDRFNEFRLYILERFPEHENL